MPTGIVIVRWDERVGAEMVANFPKDAAVNSKTLMQIYAQHEYSGDAGIVTISVGALNLASYYCGQNFPYYIILLLEAEEEGLDYETGLADTARQIISMGDNVEAIRTTLPSFYQRLAVYTQLTDEQRLGLIILDPLKRMILQRLREEVVIPRSEIEIWLKDQYKDAVVFDIEGIINAFNKIGLIRIASVKGIAANLMFFVQDIMMLRHPPVELYNDPVEHHLPKSLKSAYTNEVKKFFGEYKVTEEDSLAVLEKVILDPPVYQTIKLMRNAVVTRSDLEKLKKKGVDDPDRVLRVLWELGMITVLAESSGAEYYGLVSDFHIDLYYPAYNIDTILKLYQMNAEQPKILMRALELLKDEYYKQHGEQKIKKKKKKKKKVTLGDEGVSGDEALDAVAKKKQMKASA